MEINPNTIENHEYDVVLDALFGFGLNAAPRGTSAQLINWANTTRKTILSLDLPSGLDAMRRLHEAHPCGACDTKPPDYK